MGSFKRLGAIAASVALVGAMGLSSAMAVSTQYNGSYAYNGTVPASRYDWVANKDTANDSQFTSTRWLFTGGSEGSSVVNKEGFGETVIKTATYHPTRVTYIKACVSRTLLPMVCGSWKSTEL